MIIPANYRDFRITLLVVSLLLAALTWWGWRRLSRQRLRPRIRMAGAFCEVAGNGDVSIGPQTGRDLITLALMEAGLVCVMNVVFWFYSPWGATLHQIISIWMKGYLALAAMLLVGAGGVLFRSLGQPKIQVGKQSREINWRRGFQVRRYPFETIACVEMLFIEKLNVAVHHSYVQRPRPCLSPGSSPIRSGRR